MAPDVVCFHCGTRNHVSEGWGRLSGKCNECGTALLSSVKESSTESGSNHHNTVFLSSARSLLFKLLVVLLVVGISYLSFVGWSNKEIVLSMFKQLRWLPSDVEQYTESALPKRPPEQKETLPKEAPPIEKLPPAVAQRPGVIWNKTLLLPQAPFKIQTSAGSDYYIKLVDAETNLDAMAIYVVGGQDLEVLVPLGYYKMRYAYGETWRGEQHLFGPGNLTSVEEALDNFEFSAALRGLQGYTVRLIPKTGGNMPTRHISRDGF